MIRRNDRDSFLLIAQDDHAVLAETLARRIGNARFAAPSPLAPTVEAIRLHDAGWPLHDQAPTRNPQGLPLHVFDVRAPLAVRVWSASAQRAAQAGPYQGLLVSLHVLGLSAIAMSHMAAATRAELFDMNKFQHKQVEVLEALRRELGLTCDVPLQLGLAAAGTSPADDLLCFNFRLLTMCDRISLALCCGERLFETMNDVHPRPGAPATTIHIDMPDPATMVLDPWPFNPPTIDLDTPARRVAKGPYASDDELAQAYAAAPVESLRLTVRSRAG